jgi:hypothetical protein
LLLALLFHILSLPTACAVLPVTGATAGLLRLLLSRCCCGRGAVLLLLLRLP